MGKLVPSYRIIDLSDLVVGLPSLSEYSSCEIQWHAPGIHGRSRFINCEPLVAHDLSKSGNCITIWVLVRRLIKLDHHFLCRSQCGCGGVIGEVYDNATAKCLACNFGHVATSLNPLQSCSTCAAGKYYLLSNCQTQTGTSSCWNCPSLTYSDAPAATACKSCAYGWFPDKDQTTCVQCQAGRFQSAPTICSQCSNGYFSSIPAASACNLCSSTIPGSFSNDTGQSSCVLCPRGKISTPGQTGCSDCSLGQWSSTPGSSTCQKCLPGFSTNDTGATSPDDCLPCLQGYYTNSSGMACLPCDINTFSSTPGATTCLACANYTYALNQGSINCTVCGSGYRILGPRLCIPCEAGTMNTQSDSSFCYQCIQGKFNSQLGSTQCSACGGGYYAANLQSTSCSRCPPNSFSSAGASTCGLCLVGYFGNPTTQSCDVCQENTYSLGHATSCTPCAALFFSSPGASTCHKCLQGQINVAPHSNLTGQVQCQNCSDGYYNDIYGATVCKVCQSGTRANGKGASACFNCGAGTFSATSGATACTFCSSTQYQPFSGQSACVYCRLGEVPSNTSGASSCTTCNNGMYSNVVGATACQSCGTGNFSSTSTSCQQCNLGKYNPNKKATHCMPCPQSTYIDVVGATSCKSCHGNNIYCPIGSGEPLQSASAAALFTSVTSASVSSSQQVTILDPFNSRSEIVAADQLNRKLLYIWIVLILVALLITMSVCALECIRSCLESFDLFFQLQHYTTSGNSIVKHATKLGGYFSLLTLLLVTGIITSTLLQYFQGFQVNKGIAPDAARFQPTGTILLQAKLYGVSSGCQIASMTMDNPSSTSSPPSFQVGHLDPDDTTACVLKWNCGDTCSLLDAQLGVTMTLSESDAAASAITFQVQVPGFTKSPTLPNVAAPFTLTSSLLPPIPLMSVFRSTSNNPAPSTISVSLLPVSIDYSTPSEIGSFAQLVSLVPGPTVNETTYSSSQSGSVSVRFVLSTSLLTEHVTAVSTSILQVLTQLVSLCGSAILAMSIFMRYLEMTREESWRASRIGRCCYLLGRSKLFCCCTRCLDRLYLESKKADVARSSKSEHRAADSTPGKLHDKNDLVDRQTEMVTMSVNPMHADSV